MSTAGQRRKEPLQVHLRLKTVTLEAAFRECVPNVLDIINIFSKLLQLVLIRSDGHSLERI